MTDQQLDELRRLGEELRVVFAEERIAIGKLDHEKLTILAVVKRDVASRLNELRPHVDKNAEARALFEALLTEARATALLAATATSLVRTVLGQETTGYDKKAHGTSSSMPTFKNLRAY